MALPPVLPDMDSHRDLRLPADDWVRHQSNDYSVHPKAVGRRVHVKVDDTTVTVTLGKENVPRTGPGQPCCSRSPIPPGFGAVTFLTLPLSFSRRSTGHLSDALERRCGHGVVR